MVTVITPTASSVCDFVHVNICYCCCFVFIVFYSIRIERCIHKSECDELMNFISVRHQNASIIMSHFIESSERSVGDRFHCICTNE